VSTARRSAFVVVAGLAPVAQASSGASATPTAQSASPGQPDGRTTSDAPSFSWTTGDPVITPMPDEGKGWHMAYKSFTDWSEADEAPLHYLDETAIGPGQRVRREHRHREGGG
jgi:endo-1,4-beta-xylanase